MSEYDGKNEEEMSPTERGLYRYDQSTGKRPNFRGGKSLSQLNVRNQESLGDVESDDGSDDKDPLEGLTGMELSIKRWDLNRQKEGHDPWRPTKGANRNELNERSTKKGEAL